MVMYDKSKFKLSETFNNSDGKTSGSGFIGVIFGITTVVSWISILVFSFMGGEQDYVVELLTKTLTLGGTSGLLLGARKAAGMFKKTEA